LILGKGEQGEELVIEFLLLIEGAAYCHVSAIDQIAEVHHDVGYRRSHFSSCRHAPGKPKIRNAAMRL
jgi:hypothetical protein